MKSERYEILSMVHSGQLAPEEAERRLAILGKRERRIFRLIFTAVVLVVLTAIVIVFHLEETIRIVTLSALQNVENSAVFHEIHLFFRRIFHAL